MADLKTDNLMLTIEDHTMLGRFEKAEIEQPSPQKLIDSSRTTYRSRQFPKPKDDMYGLPVLCDFGEAKIGKSQDSGPFVQPHIYRAPEVIFEMSWGPPVDIWNVACLVGAPDCDSHAMKTIFHLLSVRYGIFLKVIIYSGAFLTPKVIMIRSSILHK